MAKYHLSKKAVTDLAEIWNYTCHKWSQEQADKYYLSLIDDCEKLAYNPLIGKAYSEISYGLLGYISGKHIIFYLTISEKEIEVVRILHGRMDLNHKF